MLLDGNIVLRHEGHHETRLGPFDQDRFDGGWITHSQGRGHDFNLMCAAGVEGEIAAVPIDGRQAHSVPGPRDPGSWLALYCADGDLTLNAAGDQARLSRGEILVADGAWLSGEPELVVENSMDQKSVVIRCMIRLTGQSWPGWNLG